MEANRVRIRIYDTQFAHGTALGSGDLKIYPDKFTWTRSNDSSFPNLCFVSESCFGEINGIRELNKIGLLIEPVSIDSTHYSIARNPEFQKKFDFILTHSQNLINLNPEKFVFYPFMGCWIKLEDRCVYEKTKDISIVASDKNITAGHKLRHEVIRRYRPYFKGSVFGRGYSPVDYKLEALKDYRFQVVIENENSPHWFTEKICDCFATGTIPIYWGTSTITDFYNGDGIIQFSSADELEGILKNCTEEEYLKRLPAVQDNLNRSQTHKFLPDNYIFDWANKQYNLCKQA